MSEQIEVDWKEGKPSVISQVQMEYRTVQRTEVEYDAGGVAFFVTYSQNGDRQVRVVALTYLACLQRLLDDSQHARRPE